MVSGRTLRRDVLPKWRPKMRLESRMPPPSFRPSVCPRSRPKKALVGRPTDGQGEEEEGKRERGGGGGELCRVLRIASETEREGGREGERERANSYNETRPTFLSLSFR